MQTLHPCLPCMPLKKMQSSTCLYCSSLKVGHDSHLPPSITTHVPYSSQPVLAHKRLQCWDFSCLPPGSMEGCLSAFRDEYEFRWSSKTHWESKITSSFQSLRTWINAFDGFRQVFLLKNQQQHKVALLCACMCCAAEMIIVLWGEKAIFPWAIPLFERDIEGYNHWHILSLTLLSPSYHGHCTLLYFSSSHGASFGSFSRNHSFVKRGLKLGLSFWFCRQCYSQKCFSPVPWLTSFCLFLELSWLSGCHVFDFFPSTSHSAAAGGAHCSSQLPSDFLVSMERRA